MLTNTFSQIAANPTQEIQFRRAVITFEGVKSDAIFAYRIPFNILAMVVLLPLKAFLTPRWFHKVNVTAVKILNAPILFIIYLYERNHLWSQRSYVRAQSRGPSRRNSLASWYHSFSAHGDIQAVFDVDPPQRVIEEIEEADSLDDDIPTRGWRTDSLASAERQRRLSHLSAVTDNSGP